MADHFPDATEKIDCISREAAIALTDQHCFETSYDAVWMEEALKDMPAADVIPVEWIETQVDKGKWAELIQRWRER